jgi:hypothetical protein
MLRALLAACLAASGAVAGELAVFPPAATLSGPRATQQLLVSATDGGVTAADRTAAATFAVADPNVAAVSKAGVVTPVGDGTTTVTATANGLSASASVTVRHAKQPVTPSFRNDVEPVLTRAGCNSGACHGALAGKGGLKLSLRAFDPAADHFALTRQSLGRRVDPAAPAGSLMLRKGTRAIPHGGGTRLDDDSPNYRLLLDWVAAGAPAPRPDEPTVTRVRLYPPAAVVKPGTELKLVAQAEYTDGTTRDVTALARFASSAEPTATADEAGTVRVTSPGEAGLSAIFAGKVATARVTVPFPGNYPATAFANSTGGRIDALVLKKLQALNVPPSGPATDAAFIRRLFLDAAGILPTPAEVAAFVADRDPAKRAKLIDAVLDRPEFVDYWAHQWSDLLLVSSRQLPGPAMWAFYQGVRRAVADNTPWDRFARDILTATGSTLDDGGGNYFVLHKDVTDLVESTTVTFLGMSVNCCRCHNHPLEKWTQDQYWGQANLFSRVGLKDGGRPGDVTILSLPAGDALHPRTGLPVPPTPLDGKPLPPDSTADRREYYADWLTAPANPYFSKALVNRVWKNYLGRGLVEAVDDLRETNPPTNPELLDALAADFAATGFDVKRLTRGILNSAAYQRSSDPVPGNATDDRFYSHYLVRRLPAAVLLDAYADVTGVPTDFAERSNGPSGGTSKAAYPAGTRAVQLPDSLLVSRFLDSFGRAERAQVCSCEASAEATVGQALHLNNGATLNEKLRGDKSVVSKWLADKTPDDEVVTRAFQLALGRDPTAAERETFVTALAAATKAGDRRAALEDTLWAVLTGREFLFNH